MFSKLLRIGTIYIPVRNVNQSAAWYEEKLGACLQAIDAEKAVLLFVNQRIILIKTYTSQTANIIDVNGEERFSITFEVDGLEALRAVRNDFITKEIVVGEIENRGHIGRNFIFYDLDGNKFDVWSEFNQNSIKKPSEWKK